MPKRSDPDLKTLTAPEVRKLLETAEADPRFQPFAAAIALAVGTGLRRGELLALAWRHVDVRRGTVRVERGVSSLDRKFTAPKSKHSRRVVTLPRFAAEALARHRKRRGAVPHPDLLVVPNELGKPLHASNFVRRVWHPLLKAAGLPRVRFHDLRHTAATLMFEDGAHPKVVQARLGHSTVALTLDTYSHVAHGFDREVARRLDRAIRGGAS